MSSSGTGMPQSPTGPMVASSSSLPTLDAPATPASPPVAVEGSSSSDSTSSPGSTLVNHIFRKLRVSYETGLSHLVDFANTFEARTGAVDNYVDSVASYSEKMAASALSRYSHSNGLSKDSAAIAEESQGSGENENLSNSDIESQVANAVDRALDTTASAVEAGVGSLLRRFSSDGDTAESDPRCGVASSSRSLPSSQSVAAAVLPRRTPLAAASPSVATPTTSTPAKAGTSKAKLPPRTPITSTYTPTSTPAKGTLPARTPGTAGGADLYNSPGTTPGATPRNDREDDLGVPETPKEDLQLRRMRARMGSEGGW